MLIFDLLNITIATLGPEIKAFITFSLVLGSICIIAILALLKKIEQKDPDRIRWR